MTTAEIKSTCGTREPDLIVLTRQTVRACLTKLDPVRIVRVLGRLMVEGSITPPGDARSRSLAGTMPDVLTGRCSPVRPCHGTVVSNPFGMSVLDIGLLAAVVEVAERAGPPSLLRLI